MVSSDFSSDDHRYRFKYRRLRKKGSGSRLAVLPPRQGLEQNEVAAVPIDQVLGDDILELDILTRLPAKALMRMKCVSKQWYTIISNPPLQFVCKQLQHSGSCLVPRRYGPNSGLTSDTSEEFISRDPGSVGIPVFDEDAADKLKFVVASDNGILCIFRCDYCCYEIGNPSFKDWQLIPNPTPERIDARSIILGFSVLGLAVDVGEDSVSYKLAVVRADNKAYGLYHLDVFSSKLNKWKMAKQSIHLPTIYVTRVAVRVKDTIYWMLSKGSGRVLCFNIEEEMCSLLPEPLPVPLADPATPDYVSYGKLGECGGKLSYAVIIDTELQMWRLDKSQWSKKISVTLYQLDGELRALDLSQQKRKLRRYKDAGYRSRGTHMVTFEGGELLSFFRGTSMHYYDTLTGVIHQHTTKQITQWFPYKNSVVSLPIMTENKQIQS